MNYVEKAEMLFTKIRDVKDPERGTDKSAGIDFFVPNYDAPLLVEPQKRVLIPSGIKVWLQPNTVLIFFNKSGVASKKGLDVMACVVDEDYRGEVHINLVNTSDVPVLIQPGEKIVQGLIMPVLYHTPAKISSDVYENAVKQEEDNLRGEGGFGSTGND